MGGVDTSLQPSSTGRAKILADAHSSTHPLKLYGGWFCPYVQRSWIVLEEKNISYEYKEINPYNKAPEFLELNPRGLVPTLAVPVEESSSSSSSSKQRKTQKPLYESMVICEYLDEVYSDESKYGPRLLPANGYERARCRLWIDHVSNKIIPGFYKMMQHTPEKEYTIQEAREEFHGNIKKFVVEMDDGGPWFLGDTFSLVDIMLAPWARRLFLIDHYKPGGFGLDKSKDEKTWARWEQWKDAILSRDSTIETWSDDDEYITAYRRYAEDTTQSEVAKATRKGGKLP